MGAQIPKYETEDADQEGVQIPTLQEHNDLVDRVNAVAAQVGGAVGALTPLPHSTVVAQRP